MSKYGNLKYGDKRSDGMIFHAYIKSCKNGEHWVTKEKFNKMEVERKKLRKHCQSINKKYRTGDVREDGMIFYCYSASCKNNEWWLKPEAFYKKYKHKKQKRGKHKKQIRGKIEKAVINERARIYYANNKEKVKERNTKWKRDNKDKIKSYKKQRLKNDFLFKCSHAIRKCINTGLRRHGYSKNSKTEKILGCSFQEFKVHIENQFLDGMNWENRSDWHLDHIMPLSMAKSYDEIIRLNHYRNFRPMWASDNIKKSNKTPETLVLF